MCFRDARSCETNDGVRIVLQGYGREGTNEKAPLLVWMDMDVGVQKVAWQWLGPSFGDSSSAEGVVGQQSPLAGNSVLEERLSRRVDSEDGMVCVDWERGPLIAF